jgi:fructosamine-3-kinase
MSASLWQDIGQAITAASGTSFALREQQAISGGCINATQKISDGRRSFFVKTNRAGLADMFAAESEALTEIAATHTVRAPQPLCFGISGAYSYLVLEYLDLHGSTDMIALGHQLAAMHRILKPQFGWHRDNVIGATHQANAWHQDWITFWRDQRLGFQLTLAADNGYRGTLQKLGEQVLTRFHVLFSDYSPHASMLHGDLWGGNAAGLADGTPVIFDPAFYYGDRECDIAMTELFGGFGNRFYAAYNDAWPLDKGYKTRRTFYNLYHILNHTNLFGGGYQNQSIDMMQRLLSEI